MVIHCSSASLLAAEPESPEETNLEAEAARTSYYGQLRFTYRVLNVYVERWCAIGAIAHNRGTASPATRWIWIWTDANVDKEVWNARAGEVL